MAAPRPFVKLHSAAALIALGAVLVASGAHAQPSAWQTLQPGTTAAPAETSAPAATPVATTPEPGAPVAGPAGATPTPDSTLAAPAAPESAAEPTPDATGEPEPAAAGPGAPRTVCEGKTIAKLSVAGQGRVSADDILATVRLREGMPCTDGEIG